MSESEFSEKNPQKYPRARLCQLMEITTCLVIRVIMLPAANYDLLSVMQRGNGGRQSDRGGFGSRTKSGKFRSDPQPKTESSMDDSEAGTLTPGPTGADISSDWDDGTATFAAAWIELPLLGGQEPASTSATQESASAWDSSWNPDQSVWDTSADQLAAQAQLAFHERQTHPDGRLIEVVAQRQNRVVQVGAQFSPMMFDYCVS